MKGNESCRPESGRRQWANTGETQGLSARQQKTLPEGNQHARRQHAWLWRRLQGKARVAGGGAPDSRTLIVPLMLSSFPKTGTRIGRIPASMSACSTTLQEMERRSREKVRGTLGRHQRVRATPLAHSKERDDCLRGVASSGLRAERISQLRRKERARCALHVAARAVPQLRLDLNLPRVPPVEIAPAVAERRRRAAERAPAERHRQSQDPQIVLTSEVVGVAPGMHDSATPTAGMVSCMYGL